MANLISRKVAKPEKNLPAFAWVKEEVLVGCYVH